MNFNQDHLCQFCHKRCIQRLDKFDSLYVFGNSGFAPTYWQCDNHGEAVKVEYVSAKYPDTQVTTKLKFKYNKNYYVAYFYFNAINVETKFAVWKDSAYENILTLDFYPDITPENVENKVSMYLLYS